VRAAPARNTSIATAGLLKPHNTVDPVSRWKSDALVIGNDTKANPTWMTRAGSEMLC
ncbi:MAG: hypothetical protein QOD93_676, partial [Acetobacteraceae bacterium]|nr:hypothetical protein [Acetobacteraceae bacterium]